MPNEHLHAFITGLYAKIDDEFRETRWLGRPPHLSDSELVCLAVAQALLGFTSEARWLRFARTNLAPMFPYLPHRPGYNKRLRSALPLIKKVIRLLATDTDFWFDNHWMVDSTPVPCGISRPTVKRPEMAGWAGYGYCATHSRFFWGLRLFLVCTPIRMPITLALANPKINEREVVAAMLDREPSLAADRPGLLVIADKGFASKEFETDELCPVELSRDRLAVVVARCRNDHIEPPAPGQVGRLVGKARSRTSRPSSAAAGWNGSRTRRARAWRTWSSAARTGRARERTVRARCRAAGGRTSPS